MRAAFWLGWLIAGVLIIPPVVVDLQRHQQIPGAYIIGAICMICALFTKQSGLRR